MPFAHLRDFRFTDAALDYLRRLGRFDDNVLPILAALRFTGELRAMPEGTVLFPDEPMLEATAPIVNAQLVAVMSRSISNRTGRGPAGVRARRSGCPSGLRSRS
jgi:nicotinic acid phosphoribosyltransferase